MKTKFLLLTAGTLFSLFSFATVRTITNSGFTFSPDSITITLGDSVNFTLESMHNAQEVTLATWQANGNTLISGGFQTAAGGGLVGPDKLTVGVHYFVCFPHASIGMKGRIYVTTSTGLASINQNAAFTLYPNPFVNSVTIDAPSCEGSLFILRDLNGKEVSNGIIQPQGSKVDFGGISPGIYILTIGDDRKGVKVVKQ
jgi:plastocyanin